MLSDHKIPLSYVNLFFLLVVFRIFQFQNIKFGVFALFVSSTLYVFS